MSWPAEDQDYYDRNHCPSHGQMPMAWDVEWEYCPFCGERLWSLAEMDDARLEDRVHEMLFDEAVRKAG